MSILIHKTYEICDEESLDLGDFAESGFVFENEPYTFHELVDLIKRGGFVYASQDPHNGGTDVWLSNEWDYDFDSGEERQETIHFSRENEPRVAKYWRKAMLFAGLEVK